MREVEEGGDGELRSRREVFGGAGAWCPAPKDDEALSDKVIGERKRTKRKTPKKKREGFPER